MASGVGVDSDLVTLMADMKKRPNHYRCVIIKFEDYEPKGSPKKVVEECRISPKNKSQREEFQEIVDALPDDQVRYLVFDLTTYQYDGAIPVNKYTDELLKKLPESTGKQLFFKWAPQGATIKEKMLVASSMKAVKDKLQVDSTGIEICDKEDFDYFKHVLTGK